jgi:hypothetical protein
MKTLNLGNNEQISSGIIAERDGTFTAMTFTRSKNFKTEAGARKWYAKATGK